MTIEDLSLLERAQVVVEEMTMPPFARRVVVDLATEVVRLRTALGRAEGRLIDIEEGGRL